MFNGLERRSLLECLSDLCGAADHVEWVLVVNVFIGRYLPAKLVRVHVVREFRHCDTREPRFEYFPIEHMNLHAAAAHSCMLLKCRLEDATAEEHARQFEIVQRFCVTIGIDVRRADKFKRLRGAASL